MITYEKIFRHPIAIFIYFVIGIWYVAYPGEDWHFYVGIFILVAAVINLIQYIKRKSAKPVRPMCEFCGYVALDERELHNHQINCEKKR